ncbi:MAG: dihydroorotate dehydrogenase electron transfer subunit [Candidatus Brocadiia bacterium]
MTETQTAPLRPALPVVLEVAEVCRENAAAVTLFLDLDGAGDRPGLCMDEFVPGRFFMLWIPRMDEKPYAVSYLGEGRVGITVQKRGPFSTRLCAVSPGDRVGLRGPYGRGFWGAGEREPGEGVALIGGGCGMAVLALLAERLPEATVVQGARTKDALFFTDRFAEQVVFTDDGSAGRQGFPTEWLEEQAQAGAVQMVYTCGPEEMMLPVTQICREAGIDGQASLERYMKCGIGVCGQCDCDGRRVCVEGPTFSLAELAEMPSFGHRRRDKTGRAIELRPPDVCPSGPRGPDR